MADGQGSSGRGTVLIISQVYVPDPASVGQHMHDAAAELAARGYRVVVYASGRGYDDPSRKYAQREILDGVDVRRLPLSSLGKGSIAARLLGGGIFLAQAVARGLFTRGLRAVMVSTSPPHAPLAGVFLGLVRRVPLTFWAMDINPDQMIAMGKTTATSLPARMFDWMYRLTLRRSRAVVPLDRFMSERLERKLDPAGRAALAAKTELLPPWAHDDHVEPIPHESNPFRAEHGLDGKLVVMYSGNISPAHPLDTVLHAAERLRDEDGLVFLFIGGGLQKQKIEEWAREKNLSNVRTLPYQPLERIKYSLSAADIHLVSMGNEMVGIVHPCKGYGALAVARPILLLGPKASHIGEIVENPGGEPVGWQIDHGDVDAAVELLRRLNRERPAELADMGRRALQLSRGPFDPRQMKRRFADILERTFAPEAVAARERSAAPPRAGEPVAATADAA